MRLELSCISPMDVQLFDRIVSVEDFQFYRKHQSTFKQMWEDQGAVFWRQLVCAFAYFREVSAGLNRPTIPKGGDVPLPMLDSELLSVDSDEFRWQLWVLTMDSLTSNLFLNFAQGTFNSARMVFKDGCTLAEFMPMMSDIGRSRSKDPFFHKNTREVYRRLFGQPSADAALGATMSGACYMRFSGTLVEVLRRWIIQGKAPVSAPLSQGDMRGICLQQFLSSGVLTTCENVRYLEAQICKKLHIPPSTRNGSPPADANKIDQVVSGVMKPAPPSSETPILTLELKELNFHHPEKNCPVCRDKIALLTRIQGDTAARKEVTLKVPVVSKDTIIQKSSVCHGDCEEFKYRAVCVLDACAEACLDTIWTNFSFRADSCLGRLTPYGSISERRSVLHLLLFMLEGQAESCQSWDPLLDTLPFIQRLWQLMQAFCELLFHAVKRVEESLAKFQQACQHVRAVLMQEKFDETAAATLRQFLACVGVAYSSAGHALAFVWTLWGVAEDEQVWTVFEPSLQEFARTMIAMSGVISLTEDSEVCAKARRSCSYVTTCLELLASRASDACPMCYRMLSILQTTGRLMQDGGSQLAAVGLIMQACAVMNQELVNVPRAKVGKSVRALHAAVQSLEADLQNLPMELGRLEAAGNDSSAASRSGGGSSRKHSCSFKSDHSHRHLREPIAYDHEEHRNDAQHAWEALNHSPPAATTFARKADAKLGKRPLSDENGFSSSADPAFTPGQARSTEGIALETTVKDDAAEDGCPLQSMTVSETESDSFSSKPRSTEQPSYIAEADTQTLISLVHLSHFQGDEDARPNVEDSDEDNDDSELYDDVTLIERCKQYVKSLEAGQKKGERYYVKEHQLAEFDRLSRAYRRRCKGGEFEDELLRPDLRPRVDYDELSRANFTFDGNTTLKNSPFCTMTSSELRGCRVNIDVSLKKLNTAAYAGRKEHGLSEYVPLYSGNCSCSSAYCLKCVNPLITRSIATYDSKEGLQHPKRHSSKSERAKRKQESRMSKVKMKSSLSSSQGAASQNQVKQSASSSNSSILPPKCAAIQEERHVTSSLPTTSSCPVALPSSNLGVIAQDSQRPGANGCTAQELVAKASGECTVDGDADVCSTRRVNVPEAQARIGAPCNSQGVNPATSRTAPVLHAAQETASANNGCARMPAAATSADATTVQSGAAVIDKRGSAPHACAELEHVTDGTGTHLRRQRLNVCSHCGEVEPRRKTFKKCNRCTNPKTTRFYCSRSCQAQDWKARHRQEHSDEVL